MRQAAFHGRFAAATPGDNQRLHGTVQLAVAVKLPPFIAELAVGYFHLVHPPFCGGFFGWDTPFPLIRRTALTNYPLNADFRKNIFSPLQTLRKMTKIARQVVNLPGDSWNRYAFSLHSIIYLRGRNSL